MTFRDEAERQRAREAAFAFHQERCRAIHVEAYDDTFDRLYPPVVEAPAEVVVEPAAPEIDWLALARQYREVCWPLMEKDPPEYAEAQALEIVFGPLLRPRLNASDFAEKPATPSPAFAAAVEALDRALELGLWITDPDDVSDADYRAHWILTRSEEDSFDAAWNAARAALVRVHLEEVERGK